MILWVGELSAHCKKDLPDRTALSGERLGLLRAAQFKGRRNECFKRKKNDFLYSTNIKLMSQSKSKFNKYCDVFNSKVNNFCYGLSLWRLFPGHKKPGYVPEMCCGRTLRLGSSRRLALAGIFSIRNSIGKLAITRGHIRGSTQSTGHDIVRNLNAVLVIPLSISDSCAMTSFCLSNFRLSVQYGSSSPRAKRAALSYTYSLHGAESFLRS